MRGDHRREAVELRLVDQEARIDRRRIARDAQPQAGGAAAIGHRLADIDEFDPADRAVGGQVALDPAP